MSENQDDVAKPGTGPAIASLVLGIVTIVFCWAPVFGAITGFLGIILAALALKAGRKGVSVAGLITSIIGFFIAAIVTITAYLVVDAASDAVEKAGKKWEKSLDDFDKSLKKDLKKSMKDIEGTLNSIQVNY